MLLRPGTLWSEIAAGLAIAACASGVLLLFVFYAIPITSYAIHYWVGQ